MTTPEQVREALEMLSEYYRHAYGSTHLSKGGLTTAAIVGQFMELPDIDSHLARVIDTCAVEHRPDEDAGPRTPGR